MSVEQLEAQVLSLPLRERRAFTRWLDEHRDEIEQPSVLTGAQESEVRQRLAEMEADPAMRILFGEADAEQMFKEIMDLRASSTPSARRKSGCWRSSTPAATPKPSSPNGGRISVAKAPSGAACL
jgi:hypothetical protein